MSTFLFIIFETSDIQYRVAGKWHSNECLELALSYGWIPIVVSTRSKLGEHDEWWQKLVKAEHVFLDDGRGGMKVDGGWRKLFKFFGAEWPKFERTGHDMPWGEARFHLGGNRMLACTTFPQSMLHPRQHLGGHASIGVASAFDKDATGTRFLSLKGGQE